MQRIGVLMNRTVDDAHGQARLDPAFSDNFPIIELKDEREECILTANLVPELIGEFVSKTLFTAIRVNIAGTRYKSCGEPRACGGSIR